MHVDLLVRMKGILDGSIGIGMISDNIMGRMMAIYHNFLGFGMISELHIQMYALQKNAMNWCNMEMLWMTIIATLAVRTESLTARLRSTL